MFHAIPDDFICPRCSCLETTYCWETLEVLCFDCGLFVSSEQRDDDSDYDYDAELQDLEERGLIE